MASTMMMDRTGMGVQGVPTMPPAAMPGMTPPAGNWLMVPRGTFKFEKCPGGMKMTCTCDDPMARSMMQNLCTALTGGMCSCTCTLNGMAVCCVNLTMGLCKVEMTDGGLCLTCTSGDARCGEMIQSCCDCLMTMCNAGCTCCFLMNSTPVCCGGTDGGAKAVRK